MTDLKMTIAIQDADLEDEEIQQYTQNFLPQIREFEGVEEAGLVPQEQPVEIPGMTSKDFGAFVLGAISVISAVKTLMEIIDWVEERWLKPKEDQPSSRKLFIEVTTPDGYKLTFTAEHPDDLKACRDQIAQLMQQVD